MKIFAAWTVALSFASLAFGVETNAPVVSPSPPREERTAFSLSPSEGERAGVRGPFSAVSYDGNWWLTAGIREQIGFLNGFRDCYLYELKGPVRYSIGTPFEWQRQITAFFERTPTERKMPAAEFILRAHVDTDGITPLQGRDAETHGPYDGFYWQQMRGTGGAAEQRGFISGYLWAHAELRKNKEGVFSKSPDQYVGLVTRWYEGRSQSGKGAANHLRCKIADVLCRFRDQDVRPITDEKGAQKLRIALDSGS